MFREIIGERRLIDELQSLPPDAAWQDHFAALIKDVTSGIALWRHEHIYSNRELRLSFDALGFSESARETVMNRLLPPPLPCVHSADAQPQVHLTPFADLVANLKLNRIVIIGEEELWTILESLPAEARWQDKLLDLAQDGAAEGVAFARAEPFEPVDFVIECLLEAYGFDGLARYAFVKAIRPALQIA